MVTHIFMIITTPPADDAGRYDRWYVDRHMPDVLAVPGFVAAQRFRLAPATQEKDAPPRYLALYEIETDDVTAVLADLARRAGTDSMPLYAGAEATLVARHIGEAVSPRMVAGG